MGPDTISDSKWDPAPIPKVQLVYTVDMSFPTGQSNLNLSPSGDCDNAILARSWLVTG